MAAPAKLLTILRENNFTKLTLHSGIPESIDKLKIEIKRQCEVADSDFRLQYMDVKFNKFLNLISAADLQNMGKVKVIITTAQEVTSTGPQTPTVTCIREESSSDSCVDTDILSSSESTSSTSPTSLLRSHTWPAMFPIPQFTYEVDMQLVKANQEFLNKGILLNPSPKLKSVILEALASEIMKYKAYPSSAEFDDVAEALIKKHPCLKELGSVNGLYGWKISLKFKIGNYRSRLRNMGCSELSINSLKQSGDKKTSPNQVKKPRRAKVNFCPDYPAGKRDWYDYLRSTRGTISR